MSEWSDVVALTKKLVAAPSFGAGGERAACEVALEAMRHLGYEEIGYDALGNVTGRLAGNGGGGTGCVLFDGHVDTVGVGDPSAWSGDPFQAWERDGFLYGRGVADMKGAIAAMLVGVARLKGDAAGCDIVVSVSVAEEEVEGVALGHVLDRYRPKAVVIGEATNLHLARAQRGRAEIVVETIGRPAHSSRPHLGRNAIKPMATLVNLLGNLPMPSDPLLGSAVLEVTDIISAPYPGLSVIPERCRATFDRRMLVGETDEDVLAEVQAILDAYVANDPEIAARASIAVDSFDTWTGYRLEAANCAPAWKMDDEAAIVQRGMGALTHAGLIPLLGHYSFCTNGSESAGRRDIPTIGFGPGHEDEAHTVDECVEIIHLHAAATGYECLARELATL